MKFRLSSFCVLLALAAGTPPTQAQCLEAVFFDLGDTLVEQGMSGLFVLRPGAAQTVQELQDFGTPIGIITNVPPDWTREDLEAVLEDPGFLDEFDVLVLSSQAPAAKPDPAIYTFAHGMLPGSIPITQTAFVGETLSEIADQEAGPTQGARAVGMVGIHLSDAAPSPLADFTIATDDLPAVAQLVRDSCTIFVDGFESGSTAGWSVAIPILAP